MIPTRMKLLFSYICLENSIYSKKKKEFLKDYYFSVLFSIFNTKFVLLNKIYVL
jgi:hypothetical protein